MAAARDPEATRAAILEAAEEVFLQRGFGAASMSEIARRAGVTKSLLHHHFGSKRGLWKAIKMRRFSSYADIQRRMLAEQEPTAELLRESMQAYFGLMRGTPELVRMMAWVVLERQDEAVDLDTELLRNGVDKVRQAQERGELRADLNPCFILFTFIGIVHHWFQDKDHMLPPMGLSPDSSAVDDEYLENAVKIFFEGVLPR